MAEATETKKDQPIAGDQPTGTEPTPKGDEPAAPTGDEPTPSEPAATAEPEKEEGSIDYAAELEAVTAERDNYRTAYLNEKDKGGKGKAKPQTQGEDDDEPTGDEPEGTDVRDIIRDERRAEYVDEISSELTENDAERRLIIHYYANVIKQSGSSRSDVRNDLETARVLANRKRVERQRKEVTAAAEAANGRETAGGGGQRPEGDAGTQKFSDADRALLDRFGADPKDVRA